MKIANRSMAIGFVRRHDAAPKRGNEAGLSLGILDGEATQALDEVDNSNYIYGDRAKIEIGHL